MLNGAIHVQGQYFSVQLGKRELILSRKETMLLHMLLSREHTLLEAQEFIPLTGGEKTGLLLQELDRDIRGLRRKLENVDAGSIEVLPGFRYRFTPRSQST